MSPAVALSLRQPWAFLVVNGFKDVENRSWRSDFRGTIYVHASAAMSRKEYAACLRGVNEIRPWLIMPAFHLLERGGIIGTVDIVDCVDAHHSRWFTGPHAFVLANARETGFAKCKGALGFFNPSNPWGKRNP